MTQRSLTPLDGSDVVPYATPRRTPWQVARTCLKNLALQDIALMSMLGWLSFLAILRVSGSGADAARGPILTVLGCAAGALLLTRGALIRERPLRALLYRSSMFCSIGASYFALGPLLPALNAKLLDPELLALDSFLFGATPATWLEPFVNRASVEWFAFFYYSYYVLIGLFIIGSMFLDHGQRRYELLLATALVFSIGHVGYTFVPGAGPYACPDLHFDRALVGGMWWQRVEHAVKVAGAQYDIFPSLHTALSLLMALHAHRYRHTAPFRWCYRVTWVWAGNIVVSTVFLRWHYGVDLIAGALLAFGAQRIARAFWAREGARDGQSIQLVWEPILPPSMSPIDGKWITGVFGLQLFACLLLLASS
jgi:membrane-associated phospholipid phosphatase